MTRTSTINLYLSQENKVALFLKIKSKFLYSKGSFSQCRSPYLRVCAWPKRIHLWQKLSKVFASLLVFPVFRLHPRQEKRNCDCCCFVACVCSNPVACH